MARKIAVDYLKQHENVQEVFVQIAYAIGKPEPVQALAYLDGVPEPITGYDLSPRGIREALALDTVTYADTATWGHFGRGFTWDKS